MAATVAAPALTGGAPDAAAEGVVLCEFCWAPAPAAGLTVRLFRWPAGGGPPRIRVVRFGGVRRGQLPTAACVTGVVTAAPAHGSDAGSGRPGGDSASDSDSRSSASSNSTNSNSSSSSSSSSSSRKRPRAPADRPLAGGAPGPRTKLTPARLVTLLTPSSGVAPAYTVRTSLPRSATAGAVTNGDALPPRPHKTTVRVAAALHDWSTDASVMSAALRAVLTRAGYPAREVGTLVVDASATARVTAALLRTAAVSATKQRRGCAHPTSPRAARSAGGWQRRWFGAPPGGAGPPLGAAAASSGGGGGRPPAAAARAGHGGAPPPPPPRAAGTATDDSAVSLVSGGMAAWSLTGGAGARAPAGDRPTGGVDGGGGSAASWITASEAPRAGGAGAAWPAGGAPRAARRGRPAAWQAPPVAAAAAAAVPAAGGAPPAGFAAWRVGARGAAGVPDGDAAAAAAPAGLAAGDAGAAPWPPPPAP